MQVLHRWPLSSCRHWVHLLGSDNYSCLPKYRTLFCIAITWWFLVCLVYHRWFLVCLVYHRWFLSSISEFVSFSLESWSTKLNISYPPVYCYLPSLQLNHAASSLCCFNSDLTRKMKKFNWLDLLKPTIVVFAENCSLNLLDVVVSLF